MRRVDRPRRNSGVFSHVASIAVAPSRGSLAKAAYTTRPVDPDTAERILTGEIEPKAGDLVLARIEHIGQHARIELASGRRAYLHVGDEIIVIYGARYAPDQVEACVPGAEPSQPLKDGSRTGTVASATSMPPASRRS